jgi:hypothetical protein
MWPIIPLAGPLTTKQRELVHKAADSLVALEEALIDWRNSRLCLCTDFEVEVPGLLSSTEGLSQ